jgi:signal transduction histidine kinase
VPVIKVGSDWISRQNNDKISELEKRVKGAALLGENEGKEKASTLFNDKNGSFVKDNNYIFALDYNGTVLSMPYNPKKIGQNCLNTTDIYGTPVYRLAVDIAKSGGGFTYLAYYNPESGKDELKLGYILPVDDNWLVGSGIEIWGEI